MRVIETRTIDKYLFVNFQNNDDIYHMVGDLDGTNWWYVEPATGGGFLPLGANEYDCKDIQGENLLCRLEPRFSQAYQEYIDGRYPLVDWVNEVAEFSKKYELPCANIFKADTSLITLLTSLIQEEVGELSEAVEALTGVEDVIDWYEVGMTKPDAVEIADALGDILVTTIGMAHRLKLPIVDIFRRIHRSNMSKLGPDGKPIYREDGKLLKGPNYQPPVLDDLIDEVYTDSESE